jgi:hypothetical protein
VIEDSNSLYYPHGGRCFLFFHCLRKQEKKRRRKDRKDEMKKEKK